MKTCRGSEVQLHALTTRDLDVGTLSTERPYTATESPHGLQSQSEQFGKENNVVFVRKLDFNCEICSAANKVLLCSYTAILQYSVVLRRKFNNAYC